MVKVFVGTSGFNYKHWAGGVFYPADLPQEKWLEFYSQKFNSVELNVTFYRLPQKSVFEKWALQTPENFVFAVKGSRFITHIKKLKDVQKPAQLFFENAGGLGQKLAVVLWQLSASLHSDTEKLEKFCQLLRKNTYAEKIDHTFEFRHESWFDEEIYKILSSYNCALCIADSKAWPSVIHSTASFVYLRFHGSEVLFSSSYTDSQLKTWAAQAKKWQKQGKTVYAYFNNDALGYALDNALTLGKFLRSK